MSLQHNRAAVFLCHPSVLYRLSLKWQMQCENWMFYYSVHHEIVHCLKILNDAMILSLNNTVVMWPSAKALLSFIFPFKASDKWLILWRKSEEFRSNPHLYFQTTFQVVTVWKWFFFVTFGFKVYGISLLTFESTDESFPVTSKHMTQYSFGCGCAFKP